LDLEESDIDISWTIKEAGGVLKRSYERGGGVMKLSEDIGVLKRS
jgi:hypothetical protein